jgi:predicted MPP superfamily phosphohydrolase
MTGDYMSGLQMPEAAFKVMGHLLKEVQPRYGFYGVFGNHDTPDLVDAFKTQLKANWLDGDAAMIGDLPLQILGVNGRENTRPGSLAIAPKIKRTDDAGNPIISVVLSHFPCFLPLASDIGADVVLSGHTHGGQLRLPGLGAFVNHSDLPLKYSSGILRHGNTLGFVSRGLGEVGLPLRMLCPAQLPLYTFRRGPLPGIACTNTMGLTAW